MNWQIISEMLKRLIESQEVNRTEQMKSNDENFIHQIQQFICQKLLVIVCEFVRVCNNKVEENSNQQAREEHSKDNKERNQKKEAQNQKFIDLIMKKMETLDDEDAFLEEVMNLKRRWKQSVENIIRGIVTSIYLHQDYSKLPLLRNFIQTPQQKEFTLQLIKEKSKSTQTLVQCLRILYQEDLVEQDFLVEWVENLKVDELLKQELISKIGNEDQKFIDEINDIMKQSIIKAKLIDEIMYILNVEIMNIKRVRDQSFDNILKGIIPPILQHQLTGKEQIEHLQYWLPFLENYIQDRDELCLQLIKENSINNRVLAYSLYIIYQEDLIEKKCLLEWISEQNDVNNENEIKQLVRQVESEED